MENEDTVILTPEEKEKILKDQAEEQESEEDEEQES